MNDTAPGAALRAADVEAALALTADGPARLEAVSRLVERVGRRFDAGAAEALVDGIELVRGSLPPEALSEGLDAWARAATPTGLYLVARLRGTGAEAGPAWDAFLSAAPGVVPEALLHRARVRIKAGRASEAVADVRLALHEGAAYELWSRAEKTLRRLREMPEDVRGSRALRLAVLSGQASTALLVPLLRAACVRDGIDVTLHVGEYDAWQSEILDPAGELARFEPDVVLLPLHWRDAALPPTSPDPEAAARDVADRVQNAFAALRARRECTLVVHAFDLPPDEPLGHLAAASPGGRAAVLRRANELLRREAGTGLHLLDLEQVAAEVGRARYEDPRRWYAARQHPAATALVPLVERQVALLRALLGLSRKVAVLDLDNTLWGGVVGEEGVEGIQLGAPSAAGESFLDFHRWLREWKERGVLLAVCSKNNEADAREPFEKHPETVLRLDDFVVFKANWQDKVSNLREIADELSLGLDSFVFVDDNPVERAWVREQLPMVAVPELPEDPALYVPAIERHRYFEPIALSDEDRQRHESYRAEVERGRLRESSGSLEDFLDGLAMVARDAGFDAPNLPRIAQLVNKTNQFNLTTRRYTEAQLREQAEDPAWWTRWFRLRDRFRDTGLIGVMSCKPREGEPGALEIDQWLMSCRVLGRQMERYMLRALLLHCREAGVPRLYGRYLPTAKNAQVAELLPALGFERIEAQDGGEALFALEPASIDLPDVPIRREADEVGEAS
ncbi:MAG: HAD-IIIC family phosphatase [Myxococcota bacterium]|nr:HAD-IIIC family phosphatase [Myxococcota bacterium]